jgi:hypothetical protein
MHSCANKTPEALTLLACYLGHSLHDYSFTNLNQILTSLEAHCFHPCGICVLYKEWQCQMLRGYSSFTNFKSSWWWAWWRFKHLEVNVKKNVTIKWMNKEEKSCIKLVQKSNISWCTVQETLSLLAWTASKVYSLTMMLAFDLINNKVLIYHGLCKD